MNKFASMLGQLTAVEPPVVASKRASGGPRKEWNPTTADIRIWKDGSVYPSQALVEKWALEFTARTIDEASGKWTDNPGGLGFDVFHTADYPAIQGPNLVGIVPVKRSEGKVDLFASCNYYTPKDATNGDIPEGSKVGDPVTSVMDQGSNTFGKELLKMLNVSYGVVPNAEGYIDLLVYGDPIKNVNGSEIYNIPKKLKKGDKAGELSYVRREKVSVFVLIPADDNQPTGTLEDGQAKQEEPSATAPAVNDAFASAMGGAPAEAEAAGPVLTAQSLS